MRQWEDLLVDVRVERVRDWRDLASGFLQWKQWTGAVIDEICSLWELPTLPKKQKKTASSFEKSSSEWLDAELIHPGDSQWDTGGKRFMFMMDSQVVQQVCCGHAALANEYHRPLFHRIHTKLVSFFNLGWLPPKLIADPVQWRPWEFNKHSDYLCNQALDTAFSFSFLDDQAITYKSRGAHWMADSDGGCRGEVSSAYS